MTDDHEQAYVRLALSVPYKLEHNCAEFLEYLYIRFGYETVYNALQKLRSDGYDDLHRQRYGLDDDAGSNKLDAEARHD